ncbi:hypothetical protein U1Q18_041465 [Sarracenia purpurea var. burkii]
MNVALENDAVLHTFETPTRQLECSSCLCSGDISVNRIESVDDSSSDRKMDVAVEDRSAINHFITPIRQLHFSALSKPSPVSGVLDDDFDESILEEIGALCEQKAIVKSEEGCSSNFQTKIQPVEENRYGGLRISEAAQNGNMPKEYIIYMDSLNDGQREAACSDISSPLMIVVGPGSGKTSTMVGRILMLLNEGIGPSNILAMTFPTPAASEIER